MVSNALAVAQQLDEGLAQPKLLLEFVEKRGVLRKLALEHLAHWLCPVPSRTLAVVEGDVPWPGRAVATSVGLCVPEDHEEAMTLARLAVAFAHQFGTRELPTWRAWELPEVAALAWARAELLVGCEITANPVVELDLQALAGLRLREALAPEQLVASYLEHADDRVKGYGLEMLATGVLAGLLDPARAHGRLLHVAKSTSEGKLLSRALVILAEPWARLLGGDFIAPTLEVATAMPGVAMARLGLARVYRHEGVLCACIDDRSRPLPQRKAAIAFWAEFATREHLSRVLSLGATDPMLFGGEAISFTRALHRRGHFVVDEHLAALLSIYIGNYRVTPAELAAISFTSRRAWVELLCRRFAAGQVDNRTLELAVEVARTGEPELGVSLATCLGEQLGTELDLVVRVAVLRTLAVLGVSEPEAAILDQLFEAPQASLDSLRALGGEQTIEAIASLLGLEDAEEGVCTPTDPRLVPWRLRALRLLWALLPADAALRTTIVRRLDPSSLPAEIAKGLGDQRSDDEWTLLDLSRRLGTWDRMSYMEALASRGRDTCEVRTWQTMAELLRGLVADVAAGAVVNAAQRGEERQTIPERALRAIRKLGQRLFDLGCVRPICLVTATSSRGAGEGLLKFLTLHLLRDPSLDVRESEVLLRQLLQQARACASLGPALRGHEVLAYLRHPSRQLRKLIIACLRETQAEELSVNLVRALDHADIETIRQAIEALGAISAKWASAELTAKLDHPNMNIKKAAAQALATAGTVEAVPKLMQWLGYHDNPGFRTLIVTALKSILGTGFSASIVAAIVRASQQPGQERRVELLKAVEVQVDPLVWRRVAGPQVSVPPVELPDRVATSDSKVRDELDRALAHLCELGWSRTYAEQVASAVFGGYVLPEERRAGLAERMRLWVEMVDDPAWTGPALSVAFTLCKQIWSASALELWRGHLQALLDYLPRAEGGIRQELLRLFDALQPHLPSQVQRVIVAQLRACSPLPSTEKRTALARLRAFGATICRRDVDDALRGCEGAPEPWTLKSLILQQAFRVTRGRHRLHEEASRALDEAIRRDPSDAIAQLRASWDEPAAPTLAGLCQAYHQAAPQHRPKILTWMEELQPLDAPTWTLTAAPTRRTKRRQDDELDVLDQPRSSALQSELVAMLRADPEPERRQRASELLMLWPELPCHIDVVEAWLDGFLEQPASLQMRLAWSAMAAERRQQWMAKAGGHPPVRKRLLALLERIEPQHLVVELPVLLSMWADPEEYPSGRDAIETMLRRVPTDRLVCAMTPRLADGEFGYLRLLHGKVEATRLLERIASKLAQDTTQAGLLRKFELVQQPLSRVDQIEASRERLRRLVTERPVVESPTSPDRGALLAEAQSVDANADPVAARRALSALARLGRDDREIIDLLVANVRDGSPRIRLHAHRLLRRFAPRNVYLEASRFLLTDRRSEVRRTAVRALGFGHHLPAVGELVGLLSDRSPRVREAAREALCTLGKPALKVLYRSRSRARPDLRSRVDEVIQAIETSDP